MPLNVDRLLPAVLSTTAGAVDVIGFLALGGLFTAHITGNLVVLAAHYVTGAFSQIGPLLAVPVFIAVLGLVTMLFVNKAARGTGAHCWFCRQRSSQDSWRLAPRSVHSPIPTLEQRYLRACSGSPQWLPKMRWSSLRCLVALRPQL